MKQVICDECGKPLFDTEFESLIRIGIQAKQLGFVYKNACLFSDKYTSLVFCDDSCKKQFYMVNIPTTERSKEIQSALDDMKKHIPEMAATVSNRIANELIPLLKQAKLIPDEDKTNTI